MKKINKILALGLAGASVLTGGLMLSGCEVSDNKANTQTEQAQDEQKAVSSIAINANTLPNYIIKGKFNRTNIKATVTYEDNTQKIIDITESMLDEVSKEEIKHVGQHNLTINHGGKTATIYANVVDERYLLKEVVEANLNRDVTVISGSNLFQIDADNKIMKSTDVDDDWVGYVWVNNNVTYDYESHEEGCNKTLGSDWDKESRMYHSFDILEILETGKDASGKSWTIKSIEKDGINYVLTTEREDNGYTVTQKYVFNDDFLLKVQGGNSDPETWEFSFNYAPITLEVPAEIRDLESEATVHVASRIEDLKNTMEDYLQSDFEMTEFDKSTNSNGAACRYDANNEIFMCYDVDEQSASSISWINGDYYYTYQYSNKSIDKASASNWGNRVMQLCFMVDILTDTDFDYSITINEDGRHYKLSATFDNNVEGEADTYEYVFNNDEIVKLEAKSNGECVSMLTYNKTNVNLTVLPEIKALESSAQ